jgi:tetratricopeptide (TPR) repeat protein
MHSRLQRFAFAGAIVLCAFAPMAIGTVHLWSIATATGLSLVLLALVIYRRAFFDAEPMQIGLVGWAFAGATLWTALQILPLPPDVLRTLSPKAHEIYDFTLGAFGLYGDATWRPLAIDPPATAQELLRLIGLTAAYLAALNGYPRRSERNRLFLAVAFIGVGLVVIGLMQKAMGSRAILGFYESPAVGGQFFTSTFVNPNHLASFLGLAAPLALAQALSREHDRSFRLLLFAAGATCALGVILSLSRAGIAALALGQVLFALLLWRRRAGAARRILVVSIGLALAAGLGLWLASERLVAEMSPSGLVEDLRQGLKTALWRDSLPLLSDFPLVGVGKGGFPFVYPLYQTHLAQYTYTHVENGILQPLVDHGIVIGSLLLVAFVVGVARTCTSSLPTASVGALAGILTVCIHNLADYNLETGGVGFPFVVVLGLLLRRENGPDRRAPPMASPYRPSTIWLIAWVGVGVAALASLVPFVARRSQAAAVERLKEMRGDAETLVRAAAQEIDRHPADYLLFLVTAARLSSPPSVDLRRAIRFANRALFLNNASQEGHWVTARILRLLGRQEQALLEYRLALQRAPHRLETLLAEVAAFPRPLEAMLEVAESAPDRRRLAAHLIAHRRLAEAAQVTALLLAADPTDPEALRLAARAELARGNATGALGFAARLQEIPGHGAEAAMLAGSAHAALGRRGEALRFYDRARKLDPRRSQAYIESAALLLAERRGAEALQVLEQLQRVDLAAAAQPRVSWLFAQAWELQGHKERAIAEYRRILARQPGDAAAAARLKALSATP